MEEEKPSEPDQPEAQPEKKEEAKEEVQTEIKEEVKEEPKLEEKKTPEEPVNYWKIAAIAAGILFIISLYFNLNAMPADGGEITGNAIGLDAASEKAMDVINTKLLQPGVEATLKDKAEESGLYRLMIEVGGNEIDSYVSSDGKLLFTSALELDNLPEPPETEQPQEVPKSDKPVVELFVMSYCPFGTQAEKGLIPALGALGDDVEFHLRFVNYAMHADKEVKEQLTQYCIREEQNDKLLPYLKCFLNDESKSAECLEEVGVDMEALETCKTAADEEFQITENLENKDLWLNGRFPKFMTDDELNKKYGISGSPGFVVNGVKVSSGRAPANYLETICGAFNEAPEACNEELGTKSYQTGFGYELSDSDAAAAAQCG